MEALPRENFYVNKVKKIKGEEMCVETVNRPEMKNKRNNSGLWMWNELVKVRETQNGTIKYANWSVERSKKASLLVGYLRIHKKWVFSFMWLTAV